MRKTLNFLTLSLLLCVAMIFGVSAVVADSDVGFYVRFDSQKMVDTYFSDMSDNMGPLCFDGEEGAMRANVISSTSATNSTSAGAVAAQTYFEFPKDFKVADYPYLRVTYKIPSRGINGQTVSAPGQSNMTYNNNTATTSFSFTNWAANDQQGLYVVDVRARSNSYPTTLSKMALSIPFRAYKSLYHEYYIYDIGLFKSEAAAREYDPYNAATNAAAAPIGLGYTQATSATGKATVNGVDSSMEYCMSINGEYTAVTGSAIEVAPGTTCYVRYAATATAPASKSAAVTVPNYWKFEITGIESADGASVDADIKKIDANNYTIELPYGTNAKNMALVWEYESSLPANYTTGRSAQKTRARLWAFVGGHIKENRKQVKSGSRFGLADYSAFLDEDGDSIQLYHEHGIYEYINIKMSIKEQSALPTATDAAEALEAVIIPDTKDIYTEENAKDYVLNAISDVTKAFGEFGFEIVDAVFVAPVDGESDGSYTFKVKAYAEGDVATTKELSFVIEKAENPVIYSFANDMIFSLIGSGGAETTKTLKDDRTALGGKVVALNRELEEGKTSTQVYVTINPGSNGMEAISDLSDYPIVVYRYKSNLTLGEGDINTLLGRNQIHWNTNGFKGGYAYINFDSANAGDTFTVGEWCTRIINFDEEWQRSDGGAVGDTTWNNTPRSISFYFHRSFKQDAIVEIDYIGFFANMVQAKAFIANPTIAGADDDFEKYTADLATVNENTEATITSADIVDDSALATARAYVEGLELEYADEAYCAVTEYVEAIDGTEGATEGVDGKIVFTVVFSENGISNAVTATSEKVVITINAADYKAPIEGEEVDGVVYGADEEAGTATIASIADADAVVVPATVTIGEVEYVVTAIAADAFAGAAATEIRLPNTITEAVELTGYEGYVFVQPGSATAEAVTGECVKLKGDYDANGETAVGDVIKVLQDLAGEGVTGFAALACDVANNDVVDVSDVIRLLQWLASSSTVLD